MNNLSNYNEYNLIILFPTAYNLNTTSNKTYKTLKDNLLLHLLKDSIMYFARGIGLTSLPYG